MIDAYLDQAIYNSYQVLTGWMTMDEVIEHLEIRSKDINDSEDILQSVNALISKDIGPIAKLDRVFVVSGLPKTRSGKIMRRILRKIASEDTSNLGDTSTLLNPEIVQEIIVQFNQSK